MSQVIDKAPDFDWEATGQEEMNQLYEKAQRSRKVEEVLNAVNSIHDLLTICHEVLDGYNSQYTRSLTSHLIKDKVLSEIQEVKKELSGIS